MVPRSILAATLLSACSVPPPFAGLVPTADGRIHAETAGAGPEVVLLHGLGDSSVTWRKLAPLLRTAGYRVTVIDNLGAGRSDQPDGPYDIPSHVRRLATVLDTLQVGRAVLVGNSLGGSIALRTCELHPERVRALCLISPAAFPEGGWTGDWLWRVPDLPVLLERLPPAAIAGLALRMNFGDARRITDDDVDTYTREAARPGALWAFVRQQQQLMPSATEAAAWIAGYAQIDLPVLVLWGDHDRVLDPAQGERLCRALPQATLLRLPGVGHAAQLESPELVLQHLLQFLRNLPR